MTQTAAFAAGTVHPAQVAGLFYPADAAKLKVTLDRALASAPASPFRAKMIVAPHAGIDYCAGVAARAVAALDTSTPLKRIVILGPNHRVALNGAAIHPAEAWSTPLGVLRVAREALTEAAAIEGVRFDAAPFEDEHSLEMPLLYLQRRFPDVEIAPVLIGDCPPETVEAVLGQLWGGPETAICISSDLSHFLARDAARSKDARTRALIETGSWGEIGSAEACGYASLRGALRRAAALRMRVTGIGFATSDQAGGPVDRVVGYGAFAFEYPGAARLPEADRSSLVALASAALAQAAVNGGAVPDIVAEGTASIALLAHRATFVTLERDGALRGCIGSPRPHRPLAGDVAVNAVRAGFADPRFPPLARQDLAGLEIKVSILSPMSPIPCRSEAELLAALRPDRDGLMLRDGPAGALFLPSVWRDVAEPAAFVRQLKRKMGREPGAWGPGMQALRFETESFGAALDPDACLADTGFALRKGA